MRTSKKEYVITALNEKKSKINTEPDYQRPAVWNRGQKQLLMDTIMRGYDIPKIYLKQIDGCDKFEFEVVDGQQRLQAIWEFCANEFALASNMDPVDGVECASKKYSDLDMNLMSKFNKYKVDAVIIEDALQSEKEDEIGDMFLRLQNGTSLKAQEKRNAMPGKMRDFVKDISGHNFFHSCNFNNSRYAFDHIVAQMVCIEIAGGPTNVKNGDLNKMYEKNKDFDSRGKVAKRVKKVLGYLQRAFPSKRPELERYNVVNLYCITSLLIESYVYDGTEEKLAKWFIDFEAERGKEESLKEEEKSLKLLEYKELIGHSNDAATNIQSRIELLRTRFLSAVPNILLKDETRIFSHEQRMAIFYKDKEKCQLKLRCNGEERLSWDNWHADHIIPHSKGGKTIVSNGQVACPECNLAKSNSES